MRLLYYDKQGQPISLEVWAKLLEDLTYKRVANTKLPNGSYVSTVWLGLNHNFTDEEPVLIFETMVFPEQDYCERYSTLEEAEAGHQAAVDKFTNEIQSKDKNVTG